MFTFKYEEAKKQFPAALIYQIRFRGGHHFTLTPVELRDREDTLEEPDGPKTALGEAMRDVFRCTWTTEAKESSCSGVVDKALGIIKNIRRIDNIEEQYNTTVEVASRRDTIKAYPYDMIISNTEMDKLWGVTQQLRFGLLLRETMFNNQISAIKLDPVFASLLNPSGGVLGSPPFWLHTNTYWQDGPLMYHQVCKDVIWYFKIYHNFDLTLHGKYSSMLSWYWIHLFVKRVPTWR